MTASFRRTLSMADLLDASDDEMDTLLSASDNSAPVAPQSEPAMSKEDAAGSSAPVLNLSDDLTTSSDPTGNGSIRTPDCKNVHFEDFDEGFKKPKSEFDMYSTLRNLKYEMDGINGVVRDNVVRLLNREEMFEGLLDRSEHLNLAGDMYVQSTEMMKRKLLWRRRRTRMVLTAFGIICACILLIPLITKWLEHP